MGTKVFGALLLILGIAVFLTIQEEGAENAFGGVFAPIETVRIEAPQQSIGGFTSGAVSGVAQTNYGKLSNRVREKVTAAMKKSEDRYRGKY